MQNKYIIVIALTAFTQATSWGAGWDETIENITASDWYTTQDSSNPPNQLIDTWVAAAERGDQNEIERLMPIVLATAISNQSAFENIPPEILAEMIKSLDERSLQQLAQVNRVFREAVDMQIAPQARRERITRYNKELFDAIDANNVEQVKRALSKGANPNAKQDGETVLMSAAFRDRPDRMAAEKQLEIVQILIDHGADVNAKGYRKRTLLILAVINKNEVALIIAHMLINNGANINTKDSEGYTALCYAAYDHDSPGMESIIDNLIKKGANIDEDIQRLTDRIRSKGPLTYRDERMLDSLNSIKAKSFKH